MQPPADLLLFVAHSMLRVLLSPTSHTQCTWHLCVVIDCGTTVLDFILTFALCIYYLKLNSNISSSPNCGSHLKMNSSVSISVWVIFKIKDPNNLTT